MPEPETPETPAAGPWADDIRSALGEEHAAAFDVFDSYMRENVQPRITQLEQNPGRELWTDLEKDADQAIYDLVAARYGDEFADTYRGLFGEETPAEETTTPPETPAEETTTPPADGFTDEEREWLRTKREAEQAEARDSQYREFKEGLKETHQLTDEDLDLIDPFIYAANGDADKAVGSYKTWLAAAGVSREPAPAPVPEPPAVLGSEAAAAATPPVASQYTKWGDLDNALGDYLTTQRGPATPPPVVG